MFADIGTKNLDVLSIQPIMNTIMVNVPLWLSHFKYQLKGSDEILVCPCFVFKLIDYEVNTAKECLIIVHGTTYHDGLAQRIHS